MGLFHNLSRFLDSVSIMKKIYEKNSERLNGKPQFGFSGKEVSPVLAYSEGWESPEFTMVSLVDGHAQSYPLPEQSYSYMSSDGRFVALSGVHIPKLFVMDLINLRIVAQLDCSESEYKSIEILAHEDFTLVFKINKGAKVGPTVFLDYRENANSPALLPQEKASFDLLTNGRLIIAPCSNFASNHLLFRPSLDEDYRVFLTDKKDKSVKIISTLGIILKSTEVGGDVASVELWQDYGFVVLIDEEEDPENGLVIIGLDGRLISEQNAPGGSTLARGPDTLISFTTWSNEHERTGCMVWDLALKKEIMFFVPSFRCETRELANEVLGSMWKNSTCYMVDNMGGFWEFAFQRNNEGDWALPSVVESSRIFGLDKKCQIVWGFQGRFVVLFTLPTNIVVIDTALAANDLEGRKDSGVLEPTKIP